MVMEESSRIGSGEWMGTVLIIAARAHCNQASEGICNEGAGHKVGEYRHV
jgi:hypothetical protein